MSATEHFDTIVIGGGQAGLATGYYLKQQGHDFLILDANAHIGDAWRTRWDSLRLFTPARYDGLPGMPFPAPAHSLPSKDEVADYLQTYAARFALPVRTGVTVHRLSKPGDRFVVEAGTLGFEADNVVVATGAYHTPRIPAFASALDPAIVQLHSSQYRRPAQLRDGGVLVVGAANSGAEIALEVSRAQQTWLSGRHPGNEPTQPGSAADRLLTPLIWFVFSHVLTVNTPMGRKAATQLRSHGIPLARVRPDDLLAAGVQRVHARIVGVRDRLPVLADGRILEVANVIWCTGFSPGLEWIDLPIVGHDGEPIHDRGVVASHAGLYFIGLFFQSAVISSLIGGVGRDAKHLVQDIARRTSDMPVRQAV
jgi:putative flavoprotein involved in K+ transport